LVITVLPLDYHANICWQVSTDAQKLAMKIVAGSYSVPKFCMNDDCYESDVEQVGPVKYQVTGSLADKYGNYIKVVSLGRWICSGDPAVLNNDAVFREEVMERLQIKLSALPEAAYLSYLTLRQGKASDIVMLDASKYMC